MANRSANADPSTGETASRRGAGTATPGSFFSQYLRAGSLSTELGTSLAATTPCTSSNPTMDVNNVHHMIKFPAADSMYILEHLLRIRLYSCRRQCNIVPIFRKCPLHSNRDSLPDCDATYNSLLEIPSSIHSLTYSQNNATYIYTTYPTVLNTQIDPIHVPDYSSQCNITSIINPKSRHKQLTSTNTSNKLSRTAKRCATPRSLDSLPEPPGPTRSM